MGEKEYKQDELFRQTLDKVLKFPENYEIGTNNTKNITNWIAQAMVDTPIKMQVARNSASFEFTYNTDLVLINATKNMDGFYVFPGPVA